MRGAAKKWPRAKYNSAIPGCDLAVRPPLVAIDPEQPHRFMRFPRMNRVAHRLSWSVVALAIVIADGCGADARSAAADDGHRRYHDGQRWIEVEVALDRFAVDSVPSSQVGAPTTERNRGILTLGSPAAVIAELDASAQEHRRRNPDVVQVSACLFPVGSDRAVTQPMRLTQHEVLVTPSIGIAVYPADGSDYETLVRNADLAMYFAKRRGPGTFAFFAATMSTGALKRLTVEGKLREAIAKNELSLQFQPQFDLSTGLISSMEALLRWNNAELGAVPPSDFIPIAEETGQILPIGEWVLRTACAQAKAWHDEGLPLARMAVNVSALQLSRRDFPEVVRSVLQETGLRPEFLELEITESAIMQNEAWTEELFKELKKIGVEIAIDDFGTGYSSFSRLKEFPIDRLKIDRSFVQNLHNKGDDQAIASAIIAMAKTLRLEVVAEGVEEFAQLMVLQDERCTLAQGFLLGRPLPTSEARLLLHRSADKADGTRTQRFKRLLA